MHQINIPRLIARMLYKLQEEWETLQVYDQWTKHLKNKHMNPWLTSLFLPFSKQKAIRVHCLAHVSGYLIETIVYTWPFAWRNKSWGPRRWCRWTSSIYFLVIVVETKMWGWQERLHKQQIEHLLVVPFPFNTGSHKNSIAKICSRCLTASQSISLVSILLGW